MTDIVQPTRTIPSENNTTQQIVVIVLTLNQREKTIHCLQSILAQQEPEFKVLLWDNGSVDSTAEIVRDNYPQVHVHHHPENLGVASGRNAAAQLAMKLFNPTHFLFLDNDMLLEPGFITGLLMPFGDDARIGQTQAKLRFMDDHERLNDGGGAQINFFTWQVTPMGYGELDHGQYDQIRPCISCGGAMMVRVDVFQELGGFDEVFSPFGPEDLDFSLRLQKSGYRALYVPQAVAFHEVSHTFGKDYDENYARHKSRHWFVFMRRHAKWWQKIVFYLAGAPVMAFRVLVREGKKGNLGAVRGLLGGVLDYLKK